MATTDQNKRLEELKMKYGSVLRAIEQHGVRMQNLHVQDDKLYIKGQASSPDVKNKIWEQIKLVDPKYSDLTVDITADAPAAGGGSSNQPASGGQTYTVKSGDTLSKLAKQYYGDAGEYMKIYNANTDKLKDPDKIDVGQVLTIPPK